MFLGAGAALAYWAATDSSNPAAAAAATLSAPTGGTQNGTATPTSIPIKWTAPTGYTPTGYTVLRCTGSSCSPSTAIASGPCSGTISGTSCSDTAVSAGTTYTYEVTASLDNWVSPASASFQGVTTAASKLVFTTQPSSGASIKAKGSGSFSVSVAIEDGNGNTVTSDNTDKVTLAIGHNAGPGGVLSCTDTGGLTVTASAGVANFTGCAITKPGTGYTLTASSGSLTAPANANAFNITTGNAAQLVFTAQPSQGASIKATGSGSFTASVAIEDSNGNTVTSDNTDKVTLAIGNNAGPSGVLSCTDTGGLTVTASAGVANFTGCAITETGTGYTLTASSGSLTAPANANAFTITAGSAAELGFTAQPSSGQNIQATGTGTMPTVSVAIEDSNGNTVTSNNSDTVTLAIGNNAGPGGVLSCTDTGGLTVTASAGVANFTGCAITKAGTGYTLTASSGSLAAPANANSFNIMAGTAAGLTFSNVTEDGSSTTIACTGPLGSATYACTLTKNPGHGGTMTADVVLVDQNLNPVDASSPIAISLTPSAGSVAPASVTISSGSSTSGTFTETLNNGGQGTVAVTGSDGFKAQLVP